MPSKRPLPLLFTAPLILVLVIASIPDTLNSEDTVSPRESTEASKKSEEGVTVLLEDVKKLVDYAIPIAGRGLEADGSFAPFGAVLKKQGKGVSPIFTPGDGAPEPVRKRVLAIIASIVESAHAGEIRASVLVLGMPLEKKPGGKEPEALCLMIDHEQSYSQDICFPYKLSKSEGLVIGKAIVSEGERNVFGKISVEELARINKSKNAANKPSRNGASEKGERRNNKVDPSFTNPHELRHSRTFVPEK